MRALSSGVLVGLELDDRVQRLPGRDLAAQIMTAVQKAQSGLNAKVAVVVQETVGPGVRLVDSAVETAEELADTLEAQGLLAPADAEPRHRFVASDDPRQFLRLGQRFLGAPIENVEIRTLG